MMRQTKKQKNRKLSEFPELRDTVIQLNDPKIKVMRYAKNTANDSLGNGLLRNN